MLINKITIEICQEPDNEVGSQQAEIIVSPALIGLFEHHKPSYYYTIKSPDGFSFNDKQELIELFESIEEIVSKCDIGK